MKTASKTLLLVLLGLGMNAEAAGPFASTQAKAFPNFDLAYTPLTPCRLIDTRGFGAPIQGGAFAANERRPYVPNGACAIPTSGVFSLMVSYASQNLTLGSGGYIAMVAPGATVTGIVGVYGSEWISSNTAVATGGAGEFDVFVSQASAHLAVDILGYFKAPTSVPTGTVTSVATGAGLSGGPITTSGTINLAATQLLPTTPCSGNQVPKWSGSAWICGDDLNTPGSGTVSNVGTGAGLTGGPVTTTGTINLAATNLLPTTPCAANQVPRWNGSAWACAPDADPAKVILNQASQQSPANFNISGNGTVGGTLNVVGVAGVSRLLPNFDSGWFYVTSAASGDVTVPHFLGVLPSHFVLYQCGALTPVPGVQPTVGSPSFASCSSRVVVGTAGYHDAGSNINPVTITASTSDFVIPISPSWWVWGYWTNAGNWGCPGDTDANCFTGYYRIVTWR